ncbi:EnvZ/OmpR regulon moderator [Escherichia coli]|uniref:EnvZ/OmpR regulon moderator n=1 Tax=Escherichia coli TaxID=562 RepID=A0A376TT05_ECOLX|nr:EnvZ/OmpR regulon moderator [Escherichia coli]
MQIPRMSLRQLAWSGTVLLLVGTLLLAWSAVRQQESTLAIRAVHQGTTMPDGFSIWHHLDAHGIPFKSITPKNDTLLITFGLQRPERRRKSGPRQNIAPWLHHCAAGQ